MTDSAPPVYVLRAEPGCAATVAAARQAGLEAHGFPLFETVALAWTPPDPAGIDALLVGSANAPRLAGPALADFAHLPVHAVGEATARACREAGLTVAGTGQGGLQAVLDAVPPGHRHLLRLAGRERVDLSPPPGVTLTERVVYASLPRPLPQVLAYLLSTRALPLSLVLLHSAEAARHFAAECDRLGLARGRILLATIGPRVSQAAGEGWAGKESCATASDQALLALAVQLCQGRPPEPPGRAGCAWN